MDAARKGNGLRGCLSMQGLLMTAYLRWRGMLETTLSLYRAAGAVAGIGATFCFPLLHAKLGMLGFSDAQS